MSDQNETRIIAALLQRYASARCMDKEPCTIGDFELIREVGRGGMGVVFEARQVSLDRRVAVKILRVDPGSDPGRIARFRREALATGRVRHRGVVPIHVIAEADGCHYYAMEFVDGRNLAAHLDAARASADADPSNLAATDVVRPRQPNWITEAVEIVAQAAEALAAAHAVGLIHRDVKPQNLMIDSAGAVRVVDFGLARELDAVQLTRTGEVAGTPRYMSPEQFDARTTLDRRTDLFSLGVVLYELLTLRSPFHGGSTQELLRAIAFQEPLGPRRLNPRVPRDLETICLTAIEKEPSHRYVDAAAMADDLRRFLAHEPIRARPPSSVTRLLRLAGRHRGATLATLLAVLLLILIGPVYGAVLAHEQGKTDEQRRRASETLAEAREHIARQIAVVQPLRTSPSARATYERVLADALEHFTSLSRRADRDDEPQVLREIARTATMVGQAHGNLGRWDEAARYGAQAVSTWARVVASHAGNDADRIAFANAKHRLFLERHRRGDLLETIEPEITAAVGILRGVLDSAPAAATAIAARSVLATAHGDRGFIRLEVGHRREEAERDLAEAEALWRGLPDPAVASLDHLAERVRFLGRLSRFEREVGELEAAQRHATDWLATSRRLAEADASPESKNQLVCALMGLGAVFAESGRADDAVSLFDEGVILARGLLATYPDEVDMRSQLVNLLYNVMLSRLEREMDFADLLEEAVPLIDELIRDDANPTFRSIGAGVHNLGAAYAGRRGAEPDVVRAHYARAVDLLAPLAASEMPPPGIEANFAGTLSNLAEFELDHRRFDSARAAIDRAIEAQTRALAANPDNPNHRRFMRNMRWVQARIAVGLGEPRAAADAVEQMLVFEGGDRMAFVFAARVLTDCVGQLRRDSSLPETERADLEADLGRRALAHLRTAIDRGWRVPGGVAAAGQFAPLATMPGFAEITAESTR